MCIHTIWDADYIIHYWLLVFIEARRLHPFVFTFFTIPHRQCRRSQSCTPPYPRLSCTVAIAPPPNQSLMYSQVYKTRIGPMMKRLDFHYSLIDCFLVLIVSCVAYRRMQNVHFVWRRWTFQILTSSHVNVATRSVLSLLWAFILAATSF